MLLDIFDLVKNSTFSNDIISKLNIYTVRNKYSIYQIFLIFADKILTKLNLRIKILSKLVNKIIYDEILLELEFSFLKSIEISDFDYIFIRPRNDHYLRQFIKRFRKKGFNGKVIGIS